ncbi:sugar porter family MFS transporter [Tanticharoenia sakaeratensis]|jgi:MFS transporter, SP family, galactose:H+ symporter|uniref:Sugar-proton symporter n=1 Tax=Tanticharoenia sakaeratensis NBRC 103193 TaxID=1231623 RepID=A0A0D6MHT6_9PROT|nr:sugar porter family MFS transporter [Tanticharoenia sakaeratensis]GAN53066.1 sugar-proton symporter [Tanticharoenia sakaeratensis NBRC 103193]GBQ19618.1 sugar-proton symporter [Tanticharoenia sakaeratensis NBRC 103193]
MSVAVFTHSPVSARRPMVGRMFLAAVLAAVAGLMFGLDIGVISGALKFIAQEFQASEAAQEWIVSSMMFGAAVGALASGRASFMLGRRMSLTISAALFVIGALGCVTAHSVAELIIARAILGLAIGVASFVAPLYISEIADESRRGSLISVYQLMITSGILLAFVSDALFAYLGSWRWMLGIVAVPGALFLVGSFFLPDSPRWLMLRGRDKDALETLTALRNDPSVARQEMESIRAQLQEKQLGFSLFRTNPNFRRTVGLGIGLQIVQQLTGINVVMYYAPRIFEVAGFGQDGQLWGTAIVGLVNMLSTFIAISFVDKWGRRPMLIAGFIIMAFGMGALATLLGMGTPSDLSRYLSVAVLLLFIMGFAFSAGPLIWILCAEVQPLQGRDFGIACSTFTNWAANMLVGATFLTLLTALGPAHTFWLYAALNALFILFTMSFVPETRGVVLEAIERKLNAGMKLRDIGR